MSLVQSLGEQYCREWIVQAIILHNERPAMIRSMSMGGCEIQYLDGDRTSVLVPHSYFTGWKVLAYPPLGYRRIGRTIYHIHRQQTAYRGIRSSVLTFEYSPLSNMMVNNETVSYTPATTNQRLSSVMVPNFDNAASLDELVAGRLFGVVPNEDICIEPSLINATYTVMYRGKEVGHMDTNKEFHIDNPAVAAAVRSAFTE